MNIVQCQFCRKPFTSLGGRICPDCMNQLDLDFLKVRDYIDDHPRANVKEIADETDVPEQHIVHLIKEGRLIMDGPAGDGGGILVCEVCHKSIKSGRMCEACKAALSSTIDKKVTPSTGTQQKSAHANPREIGKLGRIR